MQESSKLTEASFARAEKRALRAYSLVSRSDCAQRSQTVSPKTCLRRMERRQPTFEIMNGPIVGPIAGPRALLLEDAAAMAAVVVFTAVLTGSVAFVG